MKAWLFLLAATFSLIAPAANAETIEISDDRGGFLFLYQQKWDKLGLKASQRADYGRLSVRVHRVAGLRAAKQYLRHGTGVFGFHLATMEFATKQLLEAYPDDIKAWIDQHGGLTHQVLWLQAPEICSSFFKSAEAN